MSFKTPMSCFASLLSLALLCACPPGDGEEPTPSAAEGPFSFTFNLSGMEPHEEQTISVVVRDGATEVAADQGVVSNGTVSFSFADILEAQTTYTVDFFADIDGDGLCDAPPDDHAWSESIGPVSEDLTLDWTHDMDFSMVACGSFDQPVLYDLDFSGTGYEPHDGQLLSVSLRRDSDGAEVGGSSVTVAGGTFNLTIGQAMEPDEAYALYWYVDFNGNGSCDPPPTDHGWSTTIPPVTDHVVFEHAHDPNFDTSVCNAF
jgi:hypothetical protein